MKNISIIYKTDVIPATQKIIQVYDSSGINRPTSDEDRITKMYANSNLVVTAWDKEELVGIARSLSDFCYACYLSDLAVSKEYQNKGIGKKLIKITKEKIGDQSMLLLLSAPTAVEYYPKVGLENFTDAFLIRRKK